MIVTVIGKKRINRLILPPNEITGNYTLIDQGSGKRLLNIEGNDGKWEIKSNYHSKVVNKQNINIIDGSIKIRNDGNEFLNKAILKSNSFNFVVNGNEIYTIYCSEINEEKLIHLNIKNTTQIYIGSEKRENNIVYENPLVSKRQAKIYALNGVYWVENVDTYGTYVNGKAIYDEPEMLQNGDVVYIFGLMIIVMNKEIFINNPLNQVDFNRYYFSICEEPITQFYNVEDEEDVEKYANDNYFLRTPRILELVDEKEINIMQPRKNDKSKELPLALVLGSSLSMGLMTLITLVQSVDGYISGTSTGKSLIFSLLMSSTMLLTTILIPILNRQYSKKLKVSNEKEAKEEYKQYIQKKEESILKILDRDKQILNRTYSSIEECIEIIVNNKERLWERQITDEDFLTVRLGIGDVPSKIRVNCQLDEGVDEGSEPYELMMRCIEKAKIMKNAPLTLSLKDKRFSAIIYQNEKLKYRYIQNILLQLVTFQSYDQLKFVFLLKDNVEGKWDFVKTLPHLWNTSKELRFFGDDKNSINEIVQSIEPEVNKRIKKKEDGNEVLLYQPYYLIIVDDYKNVEDIGIIKEILGCGKNIGFSILFLTDSMLKLPNECQTFVGIEEKRGVLFEKKNPSKSKIEFITSTADTVFFDKIGRILSDIVIKVDDEKELQLPTSYTFLEMYNVGNINQLNINKRWREHDTTMSLDAPIGIDGSGRKVSLDIHEKFHGPHGLIAGSTGSGKSEFIITYILSLAVNFHPDDVTFVLIDYKGGGLAGAFERPDVKLPHLVGTITNIDKSSLQRSLESIQSELKRRQVEFNEAKFITGESTIDIYKYQKYYHNGVLKKPLSHLFIICDEFAELKQQEPDFMDELISVARIGRSLGVHLILATQKPSGVVNEQIRSNMKFGVCLKVQTPGDSKEVIDIPDAAKLTRAGQFYLKVGNEDLLELGQSAWAGALYFPSDEVKKDFDDSVEFVSNTGKIIKKIDGNKKNKIESQGEQLTNLVKYISDLAKKEEIYEEPLWLNPIKETIYVDELRKKYKIKTSAKVISPVIGEYDDPSNQLQNIYQLNLSKGGNCAIYGNAESGKETLLSTMIYDIINNYPPEITQLYILDFGSEIFKIFKNSNSVGDVIVANENEKVARFFMMLRKELKDRKEILSDYNGDYDLYLKTTNEKMPLYIVLLNNYEVFVENYKEMYDEILETLLREGTKYGIVFVFTLGTTSVLRYRTQQNFRQKIVLQMNKDDDYQAVFEYLGKKRPARLFGRGLINTEGKNYYEFQTAKICKAEEWNDTIKKTIDKQNKNNKYKAKEIPVVPEIVTINILKDYVKDLSKFPVGITNKNITPGYVDWKNNLMNFVISNNIEDYEKFIKNVIEELRMLNDTEIVILDAEKLLKMQNEDTKMKYIEAFRTLNTNEKSKKPKKMKNTVFIIIGIGKFINNLGSDEMFNESVKNGAELKNCSYVVIENASKINEYTMSQWYQEFFTGKNGVWLGNGIEEQYAFKMNSYSYRIPNAPGISYGYIISKGKPSLIKLLGMKENVEENE